MLQIGLWVIALAAIALVAAGCGGSSKSTTTTTAATAAAATTPSTTTTTSTQPLPTPNVKLATGTPLTVTRWIAKGDKICARVNREVAGNPAVTAADYARLLPEVAAYYGTEATELSKLVPPSSMAHDGAQIVDGIQLLSEYLSTAGKAFQTGSVSAGEQLFRTALVVQRQPIAVAARDGFKKCTDTN